MKDDMPSYKMLNEPLPPGNKKFSPIKETDFQELLSEYYDESGWDNNGNPTMKTLNNLGLKNEDKPILNF